MKWHRSCRGTSGKIMMPIGLRSILAAVLLLAFGASAGAAEQVVAAERVIYPGQTVVPDMVRVARLKRPLRGNPNVIRGLDEIVGMVASRTILPNRPIPESFIRPPFAVEAGTPVRVQYSDGGLVIVMAAVPLAHGSVGDTIKLRNPKSGQTISGLVLADGSVQVNPL